MARCSWVLLAGLVAAMVTSSASSRIRVRGARPQPTRTSGPRLGVRSTHERRSTSTDSPLDQLLGALVPGGPALGLPLGTSLAAAAAASASGGVAESLPIEATLSADQLIQHWGYPAEVHTVQTEDGYTIKLHRIPWGRDGPPAKGAAPRPPMLLQHGMLQSSDQWLLRGPNKDLALILADLGYDVWLGNFRGNMYCRRHVSMTKDMEKFWDFSWHENGVYDLASTFNYVLAVAEQPQLYYIGHSMASTALLVLLSTRPEYNSRIRLASFFAPVAYFSHPRGLVGMAFPLSRRLERDLRSVHAEMFPHGMIPLTIISNMCRPSAGTYGMCVAGYSQVVGPDMRQLNSSLFTTILAHLPAGASLGQLVHYSQVYKSGQFRMYDHSNRANVARYGQAQPPLYNLANVTAPIMFYYSSGDYLSHPKDVERLMSEVPGTVGSYKIPLKDFNHADYMWAKDTYELLYKRVIKDLRQF